MSHCSNVRALVATIILLILAAPALPAQLGPGARRTVGFIENRGQWSGPGRFLARYPGLDLWVTDDALVYDFNRSEGASRRGHVVRMEVSLGSGIATAGDPMTARHAYVDGTDRADWRLDVPTYGDVALRNVRSGVDLVLYDDGGLPRYDFHVAPGADPRQIELRFDGADRIARGHDGSLLIATSLGQVEQRELLAYQVVDGQRRRVECAFELRDASTVGFSIGAYDRRHPLVIVPLTFSSFIGGADDDIVNGVAVDSSGGVYVAGETFSPDYPYTTGSYFATLRGATDAFVSKLSADGSTLLYSTYIGGTDVDAALDVAVDRLGFAYVVGSTSSRDFPARAGYDSTYNGAIDAFVLKLDTLGRSLVWSSVIGGSSDDIATAVAAEPGGRIYVAGHTQSSNFPTTTGAFQTISNAREAFAMKLETTGRTLLYSTFIGGGGDDQAVDIALREGVAYVAGTTTTDGTVGSPFPVTTGAAQSGFLGVLDGFVVAVDTNGRAVRFSTLIGGNGTDELRGVAVDANGAAHVTGRTTSTNFPVTSSVVQSTLSGISDAFVARIGAAGTAFEFATLLGGGGEESGVSLSVTPEGRTLVAGNTTSSNFPIVTGALQPRSAGGQDLFVTELAPLGQALLYSSYLGGTDNDSMTAMTRIGGLTLYLAGTTASLDYPSTVGALQTFNRGARDGFVSRFDIVQLIAPNGRNTLCAGDSHLISWTGSETVNYDLALSANNGLTWSPIAFSVNGTSFLWGAPAALGAGTAYRIRVSVSGGGELDASDTAFTILAPARVVTHPSSLTRAEGTTVNFTASGAGSAPLGTIWQRSTDHGVTWEDIPGVTGTQLTLGSIDAADDSLQVRALIHNQCDTVATRAATLVVQALRVLTPAGGETFCIGSTQTITFSRQHVGAVNVELSTNGGVNWTVIGSNVDADSFAWTIPAELRPGTGYRIRVMQTSGGASDVGIGEFAVHSAAHIIADPQNVTAAAGTSASFTASGDGFPGYTIHWQTRPSSGGDWTDIPNSAVGTLLLSGVNAPQNGSQYRAIVTNPCGADTSEAATLTVEGSVGVAGELSAATALVARPNPAGGETVVSFTATRAATALLRIVDARGTTVRTLLDERIAAGDRRVSVTTDDLASGTYRIVLTLDAATTSIGLTVVR